MLSVASAAGVADSMFLSQSHMALWVCLKSQEGACCVDNFV